MKFIDKLERKFGRFGVPNLTVYIIGCYVLGYFLAMFAPGVLNMLSLDMSMVMKGQIWRLVTWVIYPPSSVGGTGNLVMFLLAIFFFYYPIGTSLERTWGTFRYTLYIFSGVLFTVIAAVLLHVFTGGYVVMNGIAYSLGGNIFTTYYISLSIFLAYAVTYPDLQLLLMFVIPIRMKWMLIFELVYLGYQVVRIFSIGIASYGTGMGILVGVLNCVQIVVPVLNMFWFFHAMKTRLSGKQKKRQKEFRAQFSQPRPGSGIARHKCAICGRTELTNPELQFRYCSKCVGNREYCQDHLFTHQHVK